MFEKKDNFLRNAFYAAVAMTSAFGFAVNKADAENSPPPTEKLETMTDARKIFDLPYKSYCIDSGELDLFSTYAHARVKTLSDNLKPSATARHLQAAAAENGVDLCLSSKINALNQQYGLNGSGYSIGGSFEPSFNAVLLPARVPNSVGVDVKDALALAHEQAHAEWYALDGDDNWNKSHVFLFLNEANAELNEVLVAYEMNKAGYPEYIDHLRAGKLSRSMTEAFESAMEANSDDPVSAMQKSILRLLEKTDVNEFQTEFYAENFMKKSKAGTVSVSGDEWQRLGEKPGYGNYMTPDFIDSVYEHFNQRFQAGLVQSPVKPALI